MRLVDRVDREQDRTLELDWAILETYLAAARPSEANTLAPVSNLKLVTHVQAINKRWGAIHRDQAEGVVVQELLAGRIAEDADVWGLAGDALVRRGRLDEALPAYARAQSLAEAAVHVDAAMLHGDNAAKVERSQGRFAEASTRLRALAIAHAEHPQAGENHFRALRDAARAGAADADLTAWLREHLQRWPESGHAQEVRELLADEEGNKQ